MQNKGSSTYDEIADAVIARLSGAWDEAMALLAELGVWFDLADGEPPPDVAEPSTRLLTHIDRLYALTK
jgi:hypothetical protein